MLSQPGSADVDGLVEVPGPTELFGELRKSNRRRILLNPASKFFNPRGSRHEPYGIVTVLAADRLVRP